MQDIRPYLALNGEVVKFYKEKKTGLLKMSKHPIALIDGNDKWGTTCRETLISFIKDSVDKHTYNDIVKENDYVLTPIPVIKVKGKEEGLHSSIIVRPCGLTQRMYFNNKDNHRLIKDTLNYIVSIIGVCLSSGDDEIRRRKIGVGLSNDILFEENKDGDTDIIYNVLSPFWLTSPILTSLFLGLVRNSIGVSFSFGEDKLEEFLFSKVDRKVVEDTINNVDYDKAKDIYYKVLVPFFETKGISEQRMIALSRATHRKVFQKLINEGFTSVFKPGSMVKHWSRFSSLYGFSKFCGYLNNPRSVLGYDNYYRI